MPGSSDDIFIDNLIWGQSNILQRVGYETFKSIEFCA